MKIRRNVIVSALVLLIAFTGIVTYDIIKNSKAVEGEKEIIINVINQGENYKKEYKQIVVGQNLKEVLEELDIANFKNVQYGNFIVSVDGFEAKESKQEWWKISVNGKDAETGIDSIMINQGDKIDLVLTVGW